jgi:sensor histidine kinase YesM
MKYLALIFISLISFLTFAQKYETIRYFNQNNGLNSEIIYNIEEDTNNFFWISTDNGVLKYNGNSFKKFTINNGLPSNDIFKIKIDSKNRIWLTGYYHGLYYIHKDKVFKVKNSDKYNTLEFLYEHRDTVFFKNLYHKNVTFITNSSNVLKSLPINQSKTRLFIFQDQNLEVYSDFNKNSFFIKYNNRRIEVPSGYVYYPNLSSSNPTFVKDDKIINYHSLNRVISNDIIFFRDGKWHKLLDKIVSEKVKILNRDIENSYTFLSISKNKIIVLKNNKQDYNLSKLYSNLPIDLDKIYFTFIDASNNIWVITNANQLIFIPKNYLQISSYNEKSIFGNNPSTIKYGLNYKDKFFLITNDNLFGFFDKKNKKYSIIDTYNNEIPYKLIANDKLLILCTNNSHYYYDNTNFKLLKKLKAKSNKNSKIIDNKLFFSKGGSLNTNDGQILQIKKSIRFKDFLKINDTYYCSNENHIISKSVKENTHKRRALKYINVIEKYNDYIIVGTNSNGLMLLDQNLKTICKIDNSKNICDIKIEKNIVYVLTTNSLYVYQILNNKFILLKVKTNKDGILDSRNKNINTDNNNIYIFSQSGITIIDKRNLAIKSNAKIDFECSEFSTNEDKVVRLKRENNTLNFLFNVNSFENEGNFKKLIRFDSDYFINNPKWEEINNKNFTYKDLNPGYYTLTLKLTSENLLKDEVKEIKFYIEPYFWETKLFYFVVIIVFVSILVFLFLYYKRRVAKKYQLINKMNDLELKALKSQMNPHFVFNTLNGLQSIIFTKSEIEINNYFVKFSRLLRITLEILNKDKVTFNDEINYLKSYVELEQVRKINDFIFTINIESSLDLNKIEVPVMLLQPLVENAIEHGINKINTQGILKINVKYLNHTISVEIEDNGIGIDLDKIKNKKYTNNENSFACNIIKDRIKILNIVSKNKYKIEWFNLNSENKTGTRVVFSIVLNNSKK